MMRCGAEAFDMEFENGRFLRLGEKFSIEVCVALAISVLYTKI